MFCEFSLVVNMVVISFIELLFCFEFSALFVLFLLHSMYTFTGIYPYCVWYVNCFRLCLLILSYVYPYIFPCSISYRLFSEIILHLSHLEYFHSFFFLNTKLLKLKCYFFLFFYRYFSLP